MPRGFTSAVGVLEIGGGAALVLAVAVVPAAVLLALDMAGAIVVSGLAHGEWISLTLAPVLLVAILALVATRRGPIDLRASPVRRAADRLRRQL